MRLIVGLGNPGTRYRDTPHNAGFRACDRFVERHRLGPAAHKFGGAFYRGRVAGRDVGVLEPETFMNLSGESVADALRYLPVEAEDLIVLFDDMDLPLGRVRIRPRGGAGGHNGVRSLIEHVHTQDFARIRIGVGRPAGRTSATGHLLGRVRGEDRENFEKTVDRAVEAVEAVLDCGVDEAMNRFNGLPPVGADEGEEQR